MKGEAWYLLDSLGWWDGKKTKEMMVKELEERRRRSLLNEKVYDDAVELVKNTHGE